jgi:Nucleotide modification associated domain 1
MIEPSRFEMDVMDTFSELETLLLKKHKDYGPRNIADAPGGAINGLRVRMHDKLARINNLIENNRTPENESFEDSFKDLANYAIIGLLVLRGKWNND